MSFFIKLVYINSILFHCYTALYFYLCNFDLEILNGGVGEGVKTPHQMLLTDFCLSLKHIRKEQNVINKRASLRGNVISVCVLFKRNFTMELALLKLSSLLTMLTNNCT